MFLFSVWTSFSHSSCTPHVLSFTLVYIFFSFPPSYWLFCLFMTKRGRVYRRVYRCVSSFLYDSCAHFQEEKFYLVHIHRGRKSKGRCIYQEGEDNFYEKNLFCLVFPYACFLVVLWCVELSLISMLCYSHCIVLMCWTCIHPFAIVLYWLHVRVIICFAIWSL